MIPINPMTSVVKDHRMVLYHMVLQQEMGMLTRPCTLVNFDRHDDGGEPVVAMDQIIALRRDGFSSSQIRTLCEDALASTNGDWIRAGMELGVVKDAVVFKSGEATVERQGIMDHMSCRHWFGVLGRPGRELVEQGALGDYSRRWLDSARDSIGWMIDDNGSFGFRISGNFIALSFDLDYFTIPYDQYVIRWPEFVFAEEFSNELVGEGSCRGWSSRSFIDGLFERCGSLTVATEPVCCGGSVNSKKNWDRFKKFVVPSSWILQGEPDDSLFASAPLIKADIRR